MDYNQKVLRISDLIAQEPSIPEDSNNSYAREDLDELVQNIRDFLGEKKVEEKVLSTVAPVITKYCKYIAKKEDDPVKRNDSISNAGMFLANVPLRAYAASALLRLEGHLPRSKYSINRGRK